MRMDLTLPLPPLTNGQAGQDFLKLLSGFLDVDAIARHLVRTLPDLVGACGLRLLLHDTGRPGRVWSTGT